MDSAERAEVIANDLVGLLEKVATPARPPDVERYWKIPEYFGLLLRFDVNVEGDAEEQRAVDVVSALPGTGWLRLGRTEAIWNHGPGASFVAGEARWAQVELIG